MTKQLVALVTCYNRKGKTLECLTALRNADAIADLEISVALVDDGSDDGTSEAVRSSFPEVIIERGDGSLFWSRGMCRAQQIAVRSRPDFLLWLNDDTKLSPGALNSLLSTHARALREHGTDVVVVGATVDPSTMALTYGGLRPVSRLRRFSFAKLPLASGTRECEAMNGNIVLVPKAVYECVGALDPVFEHALGDIDYAFRVRAAGFSIFVAPGFQGTCSANKEQGTHLDPLLPMRSRWRKFVTRKGLPPSSWRHFVRSHAGWAWPAYFVWPYISFAARLLLASARTGKSSKSSCVR